MPGCSEMNNRPKFQHLVAPSAYGDLASLFTRAYNTFSFYRRRFQEIGLDPEMDPVQILDELPDFSNGDYLELQREIFGKLSQRQFVTDYTSGTTGDRKIRVATRADEEAEAVICERFFRNCGVGLLDRVLAIDLDSSQIYSFYGQVLR